MAIFSEINQHQHLKGKYMKILVTGGTGFIGSNLVKKLIDDGHHIVNLDLMTYAANAASLESIRENPRYSFYHGNICHRELVRGILKDEQPECVFHLAAESHVDRSIGKADDFIDTNILGTYTLLTEIQSMTHKPDGFKFIHVSTDEVYGSLGPDEPAFDSESPYRPNSPYAASKASSDLLARAWRKTFNMPVIITHCSNNYGPNQNIEKFIPKTITNILQYLSIPIYGNGLNIRDWIHVSDHCDALIAIMNKGEVGKTYCIGGNHELTNLEVIDHVILALDKYRPGISPGNRYDLKTFVPDRLGHDLRYAINNDKITDEIGWKPKIMFEEGIAQTIEWYSLNLSWWIE